MKLSETYNKKMNIKLNGKLSDIKLSTPDKGKIVAIARHGSTDSNGEKVFRGWKESSSNQLTSKGQEDATNLGEEVKKLIGNENPDDFVLVFSDLNRAEETASIASKISKVPMGKAYKELRSQDTGDYSGKKEEDVKQEIRQHIKEKPDVPLKGATESHVEFLDRIKRAFSPVSIITKDYPGKKIIVVTHHQVDVEQANNFSGATDAMFAKGMEPGALRKI